MESGQKASLETLPLELQQQIFEYVIETGPAVNIVLRDGFVLHEENHFNVMPKNPPHPFAKFKCSPSHITHENGKRECINKDYTIPQKWSKTDSANSRTWAISVIYQLAPIPRNLVCVSKAVHKAVASVWYRMRKRIKELLDSQISHQGWKNLRHCGSYRIIWYTDFIQNPSKEMLEICRRSRFIFDLEGHSLFATLSTLQPQIAANICNLVLSQDLLSFFGHSTALASSKTLGVILDDSMEIPWWSLDLIGSDARIDKIQFIDSATSGKTTDPRATNEAFRVYTESRSRQYSRQTSRPPNAHSHYTIRYLTEDEVHDSGRYMANRFHEEDGKYYQERVSLEERVFEVATMRRPEE